MQKLSILLVDDHNVVRSGIRLMLETLEDFQCEFVQLDGKRLERFVW